MLLAPVMGFLPTTVPGLRSLNGEPSSWIELNPALAVVGICRVKQPLGALCRYHCQIHF